MASRGINKVILIGNLGQNPEIRYMSNGSAVANFTLATSEIWRNKQNSEIREKTEWHRIVIFGKLAEIAGEYLRKGSQVYIEGSLQTRKWQDQNGKDHYFTEVVVNVGGVMQMLGSRNHSQEIISQSDSTSEWNQQQLKQSQQLSNDASTSLASYHSNKISSSSSVDLPIDFDDEIPF